MKAFGLQFKIISDVQQPIKQIKFEDGAAIHIATIKRGVKEYIVFKQQTSNATYIEEVEAHSATFRLNKIEDDQEWQAIALFCRDAGLLSMSGEKKHASAK